MAKKSNKKKDVIEETKDLDKKVETKPVKKVSKKPKKEKKVITNPYNYPITLHIGGKIVHIDAHKSATID